MISDEEELKDIERNRLKRKRCVLTYLPDVPTPKYGTTYGVVDGGILRSCEKETGSSSKVKKRVSFHKLTQDEELGGQVEVDGDGSFVMDWGGNGAGGVGESLAISDGEDVGGIGGVALDGTEAGLEEGLKEEEGDNIGSEVLAGAQHSGEEEKKTEEVKG